MKWLDWSFYKKCLKIVVAETFLTNELLKIIILITLFKLTKKVDILV